MRTKLLRNGILLLMAVTSVVDVFSQEKNAEKSSVQDNSYDVRRDASGILKESVHTFTGGKEYRFNIINNKVTNLYVDGEIIPADKYSSYESAIAHIRKQMEKAKRYLCFSRQ